MLLSQNITPCCRGLSVTPNPTSSLGKLYGGRREPWKRCQDTLGSTKVPLWALKIWHDLSWEPEKDPKWKGMVLKGHSTFEWKGLKKRLGKNITFCFHPQVLMNAATGGYRQRRIYRNLMKGLTGILCHTVWLRATLCKATSCEMLALEHLSFNKL